MFSRPKAGNNFSLTQRWIDPSSGGFVQVCYYNIAKKLMTL
jgi:hypothetical protein